MQQAELDAFYMQRCIDIAKLALGNARPNPMVGSVIVHNGKIIGEGYHCKSGEPHAEVNAIRSVRDESLLRESTIYVSLEPCSHYGKTPPCSDLIIEKQIPRVVIGVVDSFSEVSGRGIEKLRNAGCDVTVGVLESDCWELNKRFFNFHEKKRPYIILKWAETQDGFIDVERKPDSPVQVNWITNAPCKRLVHKWRTEEDAILIGTNTAENDNPKLNVREWDGENPIRIGIDNHLRLSTDLALFDSSQPTYILNWKKEESQPNLQHVKLEEEGDQLQLILKKLYEKGIQSVIIEGGQLVLQNFIDANLWDEARVFIGNRFFGAGTKAPMLKADLHSKTQIGDSSLYWFRNK